MNDVIVYMYGMITGMAIICTLVLANHILIKLITAEWPSSQQKRYDVSKANVVKGNDF
jgi:hypothetical protein